MNFEIEGEKYAQAIGDFLLVYYREELKNGSLKKTIKVYAICFAILIGLCFITPGMKELYFLVMGFLLFMVLLVGGVVALSVFINKKKVKNSNIVKVEQIYEDKISVNAYLVNGSIEKTQYNYSDIKKVVETEKCFYLFLTDSLALPLTKSEETREAFIEFMFSKNIVVRECK